jgi:CubicO group peptidase (beta-lactamase class C family)
MRRGRSGVDGGVAEGYGAVADAFADAVESSRRGGAALTILVGGETVVDLWGGSTGKGSWAQDTPTVLFSCSKGMVSALVARLVEQGRLDLDSRVTRYWPEFGQAGKSEVTVRMLLSHRAGLCYPIEPITKADMIGWDPVVAKLAAQRPLWELGERWSYHAITFGWIVGEVIRRVTGTTVGRAFAEEIAGPVDADVWFGVPEDRLDAIAEVAPMDRLSIGVLSALPGGRNVMRALTLGGALPDSLVEKGAGFNDPELQVAEIPGAGGIATAPGIAAVWSSMVVDTERTRALGEDVLRDMTAPLTAGRPALGSPVLPNPRWGTGFQVDAPGRPFLTPRSFGHDGAGGQLAFADPDLGMGFAFLTNDMGGLTDRRSSGILRALRATI